MLCRQAAASGVCVVTAHARFSRTAAPQQPGGQTPAPPGGTLAQTWPTALIRTQPPGTLTELLRDSPEAMLPGK